MTEKTLRHGRIQRGPDEVTSRVRPFCYDIAEAIKDNRRGYGHRLFRGWGSEPAITTREGHDIRVGYREPRFNVPFPGLSIKRSWDGIPYGLLKQEPDSTTDSSRLRFFHRVFGAETVSRTPAQIATFFDEIGDSEGKSAAALLTYLARDGKLQDQRIKNADAHQLATVMKDQEGTGIVYWPDADSLKMVSYRTPDARLSSDEDLIAEAGYMLGDEAVQRVLQKMPGQAVFIQRRDEGNQTFLTLQTADATQEVRLDHQDKKAAYQRRFLAAIDELSHLDISLISHVSLDLCNTLSRST